MLIKLVIAVKEIERATSPSANFVNTLDVTPPGAAAINVTPNANSIGVLRIIIKNQLALARSVVCILPYQATPSFIQLTSWSSTPCSVELVE